MAGMTYWWKKEGDEHDKSWLVLPIGYVTYALTDGIHTALKQPK
jgi:hypothetical protein